MFHRVYSVRVDFFPFTFFSSSIPDKNFARLHYISNMMGVLSETGTAHPMNLGSPPILYWCPCYSCLSFLCCIFCLRSVFCALGIASVSRMSFSFIVHSDFSNDYLRLREIIRHRLSLSLVHEILVKGRTLATVYLYISIATRKQDYLFLVLVLFL